MIMRAYLEAISYIFVYNNIPLMFNNSFKRGLLIVSLSLNLIFVLFFIGKRFYYGHQSLFHHVITQDECINLTKNAITII